MARAAVGAALVLGHQRVTTSCAPIAESVASLQVARAIGGLLGLMVGWAMLSVCTWTLAVRGASSGPDPVIFRL